jgi:hypothetical protein
VADSFTVSSRFLFTGNLEFLESIAKLSEQSAAGLEAMAKAMRSLNRTIGASVGVTERATAGYTGLADTFAKVTASADGAAAATARLNRASTVATRSSVGGVGGGLFGGLGNLGKGLAIGGLATEAIGIRGASNLQDASIQTAIALGRSNKYVSDNLVPLAMQMSMSTAQSVTASMGILRTMATSGINDPAQLRALAMPIAKFADTQYLGKNHVSFDQSTAMLATLAHELNLRTAGQLAPFANTLFKISNDMPDSLKTAAKQIKYYGANFANAGVSPSEILMLQATADRLGYGGGKSGTGLNMALRNLQNPSGAKMLAAQSALGLLGADGRSRFIDQRTGAFNPEALFAYLNTQYNAARKNGTVGTYNQELGRAFNTNAGLIVGAFSSNAGIAQRANVTATMSRVEDLQKAQVELMGSLNNQTKLLTSNFQTLATLLASPLIAPLTSLVGNLAKLTGGAAMYLSQHPAAQNIAAGGLAVVSAAGAYYALKMLGGIGVFAHAAAKAGGIGIGGWGHLGGAGEGIARMGGGIGRIGSLFGNGVDFFPTIGRLGSAMKDLGGLFRTFGREVLFTRGGLSLLAETVGRLGLRAIPVIGNITLIIDAIQQFVKHGTDINFALGKANRWIDDVGKPALVSAITGAWAAAMKALANALPALGGFIRDSLWNSITGNVGASTGFQGMAMNFASWIHQQQANNDAAYRAGYGLLPASQAGNGQSVVVQGDLVLPGVKNKEDLGKHFRDFRKKTSLVQGAPVSSKAPAWLTIGKAYGQ